MNYFVTMVGPYKGHWLHLKASSSIKALKMSFEQYMLCGTTILLKQKAWGPTLPIFCALHDYLCITLQGNNQVSHPQLVIISHLSLVAHSLPKINSKKMKATLSQMVTIMAIYNRSVGIDAAITTVMHHTATHSPCFPPNIGIFLQLAQT